MSPGPHVGQYGLIGFRVTEPNSPELYCQLVLQGFSIEKGLMAALWLQLRRLILKLSHSMVTIFTNVDAFVFVMVCWETVRVGLGLKMKLGSRRMSSMDKAMDSISSTIEAIEVN